MDPPSAPAQPGVDRRGEQRVDGGLAENATGSEASVRAVATEFLRLRPLIVAPLLVVVLVCIVGSGAAARQIAGFAIAGSVFLAFFLRERRLGSRRVVSPTALERSLAATLGGITIGTTLTGAFASPVVPMLFAPVGIGFAAFGPARASARLFALLGCAVACLFVLTPVVAPLALSDPWRRIAFAAALLDAVALLYVGVSSLAAAHGRAAAALVAAGDRIVRAAEARTREVETIGARVAHEVKNPLAAIRALVEVMRESAGDEDERAQKRLTVASGEIARIEQILADYRAFARPLDAVRRERIDVARLADDVVVVLEARAARAGVRMTAEPVSGVDAEVDPDRLSEAVLNLVLNALDAARTSVRVVVVREPDAVVVRVTDDGPEMDAAKLARIGEVYFTTKAGGTGLGVSIARRTAEQHGGTLTFTSEPGAGTTATLRVGSR